MSIQAKAGSVEPKKSKAKASRKGKQAWRKNIDLATVETGLEERLTEKIKGGVPIDEQPNSDLFQLDIKPDASIVAPPKKKLRIEMILEPTSKINVPGKQNKQFEREVYQDRYNRKLKASLKALVGKSFFSEDSESKADKPSINQRYDIWAEAEANENITQSEKQRKKNNKVSKPSTMELHYKEKKVKKPIVPMSVLDVKKLIAPAVELPDPGMSYYPDEAQRMNLVNKIAGAITKEVAKEKKLASKIKNFQGNKDEAIQYEQRKSILDELKREADNTATEQSNDQLSSKNKPKSEPKDENEIELGDSDTDVESDGDAESASGSDNPDYVKNKTATKRKTRAKRNREARVKKQDKNAAGRKSQKLKTNQLKMIKKLSADVDRELAEKETAAEARSQIASIKATIPKTRLGKYSVKQIEVPVKLSDKLTDSLRTLKPESNLLLESFVGLQRRNLIEPRVRVEKKRRYKLKSTEKWSYKDFK